jgi:hypothetical protein
MICTLNCRTIHSLRSKPLLGSIGNSEIRDLPLSSRPLRRPATYLLAISSLESHMVQCSIGKRPSINSGLLRAISMKELDMNGFEQMGHTLLQTAEGNRQIAAAIAEGVSTMAHRLKAWATKTTRSTAKPT